eukprot:SAG31_NODE_258_length_18937_cov_61.688555_20_plen_161_part_00
MALPGAAGLFGLAIVWVRSSMAVEVPGWDYPPLPGTARKTPESLVRVYEDVFSEEMLAAIDIEVPVLDHLAHNFGSLRNHKRVTFWRGRHGSPRFAIERMIKLLEQVTFPSKLGGVAMRHVWRLQYGRELKVAPSLCQGRTLSGLSVASTGCSVGYKAVG